MIHLLMTRRVEVRENEIEKTKRFVKKNWPLAVAIAGAAGLAGAAVWLTARYLRESKKRDAKYDGALEVVENEVETTTSESAALLESGSYLGKISGEEGERAIDELAENTESLEGKDAFEVLKDVVRMGKRGR
jgi:hypothetical protein